MRNICLTLLVGIMMGNIAFVFHRAIADETSSGDKLRILYSNRFTFTDEHLPLVTIEIMSGQDQIQISSPGGVVVLPNDEGGAQITGGTHWTVRAETSIPPEIVEWTVVESFSPGDMVGLHQSLRRWKNAGETTKTFEIGTIFAVEGEVIDSRKILVGLSPTVAGKGKATAKRIARQYDVQTSIHEEMTRRPSGTILAKDGNTLIRNASVLWFAPVDPKQPLTIQDVVFGGGGSQLETKRENRRYFGRVYVTFDRKGKLTAVNAVAANDLLAGLVPAEMFASAPAEALAAQAIAARTELLQKIGMRHLSDPFLLCSSQHCQVYSGAGKEHPRTTRAVRNTKGVVLVQDNGQLVDARYSASCGGHGEHNDNIWPGAPDPVLRGAFDSLALSPTTKSFSQGISEHNLDAFLDLSTTTAACGRSRFSKSSYRWAKQLSAPALEQFITRYYPDLGTPIRLEPLTRGVSGRIRSLRIVGTNNTVVVHGDLRLRRVLSGLKSSLFSVEPIGPTNNPSAFLFRGAGFGHGVGMCQLGAIGMAEDNVRYSRILQHYYRNSRLQRIY